MFESHSCWGWMSREAVQSPSVSFRLPCRACTLHRIKAEMGRCLALDQRQYLELRTPASQIGGLWMLHLQELTYIGSWVKPLVHFPRSPQCACVSSPEMLLSSSFRELFSEKAAYAATWWQLCHRCSAISLL